MKIKDSFYVEISGIRHGIAETFLSLGALGELSDVSRLLPTCSVHYSKLENRFTLFNFKLDIRPPPPPPHTKIINK